MPDGLEAFESLNRKAVIEEVPCFHLTGEQLERGTVCGECGYDPKLRLADRSDDLQEMLDELREDS